MSFDFNILQVASLLGLHFRKTTSEGLYADCPFCGKKQGKLHLHVTENVFRCNRCGESGGMLRLYSLLKNMSNSESYKEIKDSLRLGIRNNEKIQQINKEIREKKTDAELADISNISEVYKALLSKLTLSTYHKEMLIQRGFSSEQIEYFGYKTVPLFGHKKIAKELISEGHSLNGIPGFYIDFKDNCWTISFRNDCPGILVPSTDIENRVICLEKRLDKPYKNNRYFRFSSSGLSSGTKSVSCVNFCGNPYDKNVYLTEGSFKSSIAHSLSGKTFIGMQGVSNYSTLNPLLKTLKRNGTTRIIECLDMDKYTNSNVGKLRLKIISIIKENGFKVETLKWNPKFKGIDDYLASFRHERYKQTGQ